LLALNSQNPELKYLAQKAFVSYVRSVHVNGNKDVFTASELPLKEFAESLGLIGTPRIRFIQKIRPDKNIPAAVVKAKEELNERKKQKEQAKNEDNSSSSELSDYESDSEDETPGEIKTKAERLRSRVNQGTLSEHYTKLIEDDDDEEDDLLVSKRLDHDIDEEEVAPVQLSKRKKKRLLSENISGLNKRVVFDDDGNVLNEVDAAIKDLPEKPDVTHEEYISGIKEEIKSHDREDYLHAKQIRREKKAKRKQKEQQRAMEEAGIPLVQIAPLDDFAPDSDESSDAENSSDMEHDIPSGNGSSSSEESSILSKRNREEETNDLQDTKKQKVDFGDIDDIEERALKILEAKGF